MREILFRGKRLGYIDNAFIYGSLGVISTDLVAIYQCKEFAEDDITLVDIGTVGQYTGLTDKNDKKIFEGDVLKYTPLPRKSIVYEVIWQEERSRFALKTVGNGINLYEWLEKDKANCCCEVIGNIHDNPELLKGGD